MKLRWVSDEGGLTYQARTYMVHVFTSGRCPHEWNVLLENNDCVGECITVWAPTLHAAADKAELYMGAMRAALRREVLAQRKVR